MNYRTDSNNRTILDLGNVEEDQILIFGGVYSNFHSLQKMLEIAEELGIESDQIICTGDTVAYCADPEKCAQMIKKWGIWVIKGNVEQQLIDGEDNCGCNFNEGSRCDRLSQQWYPFVQKNISKDSIQWMETLPDHIMLNFSGKKLSVVHGSPANVAEYIFASTAWNKKEKHFSNVHADIIIGGHCGLPFADQKNGKTWINAGVIGMPANDGTPRVWYLLLKKSSHNLSFEIKSYLYDYESAHQSMMKSGLPLEYAKTLKTGLWDNCEILPDAETQNRGKILHEITGII